MKSLLAAVMLILTVITIYVLTIGADDGVVERLPDTGEQIGRTVESLDP